MVAPGAVGLYVDAANIQANGGFGMQYDVLRRLACRSGGEALRLNVYAVYDDARAARDYSYQQKVSNFFASLRDLGYKVIVKHFRWYTDDEGRHYAKANADLEMAVDALTQSRHLSRVVLATGDGDFVQVVSALQDQGCRVEVVAFENVSSDLKRVADDYICGYLIPGLQPIRRANNGRPPWGEPGSRVRGICYYHAQEGSYGFIRYLRGVHEISSDNLWITDTRDPESPYASAFFHDSDLPEDVRASDLPSHAIILEFDLVESQVKEGSMQAVQIQRV
ncbi:NYN domain-containing protein [Halorhodospira halochloris]|uniref:LabA-like NYN domain-containing protein n=1 Tax=Halorhodospira halochloris TaxID=1052 RepID=UPI001EE9A01B|nr:NYN domain-containing protein [Halorhodospira halochloris]MCG5529397.1 NYN domain-containing protein [Halorhodospira halochloris]MCG5547380.1 NYN domain-containing protein [Halorhodospira halochloris]